MKTIKTICFISPTGTLDNGAEISIYYLMKLLVFKGYKVINIAPNSGLTEYVEKFASIHVKTYMLDVCKWWWIDAPGRDFSREELVYSSQRRNIDEISEIVESEKVDLVITNTINIFQGMIAAALNKIPHFQLIHEFPENEFSYFESKIDFISDYSSKIFSVCGELNKTLKEKFVNKDIEYFIPYTEIKKFQLKDGGSHRIVCVGRLTPRKNQLELIKAYEKLNMEGIKLVFIGDWDKDYKEICDKYIKENKILGIQFLGNKKNPWKEVTDKDICVFTSSMETFGLVYIEALMNGIPVILSDNKGHNSAYEIFSFGYKYELGNLEQLTDSIRSVLINFVEEKRLAIHFIKTAESKYLLDNCYKNILNEIKQGILPVSSLYHIREVLLSSSKGLRSMNWKVKFHNFLKILLRKIKKN
ncbi:MAG: glycosyltransferase family 4 protein [Lactobacillales bacterium]|jgi:glycosyltransferase involved in cell wall biosynthesis|nr:glycosyltransferase family 4 protein [Lactobacillales bacterium]